VKKAEPRYATVSGQAYQQRGGMGGYQQPGNYGGGVSLFVCFSVALTQNFEGCGFPESGWDYLQGCC